MGTEFSDKQTNKILDQVAMMESLASSLLHCATELRKSLSPIQERTPRKGLSDQSKSNILNKRRKHVLKK